MVSLPRLLGEVNDTDTQFTAAAKKYQDFILIGGVFITLLIVAVVIMNLSQQRTGTWRYGLCKVFLERYVQYPTNIKILTAGEKQNSAQIGYLVTNAYGSRESQLLECFYNTTQGVQLSKVTLDRIPLDKKFIEEFNPTIPVVMAQEDLDLFLPERLPDNFEDLKFN